MINERNTDKDWEKIGLENPYWGVISAPEFNYLKEENVDLLDRFYKTGEDEVNKLINTIKTKVKCNFEIESVLDFGSGVGRLLLPFAQRTSNICYGCDISEGMHEKCLIRANYLDLNNIKLIQDLENIKISFSLVNTRIVLQHIPPKRGINYINKLAELVKDNGIFSLQFTVAREKSLIKHNESNFYIFNGDKVEGLFTNIGSDRPSGSMSMFDYSLIEIVLLLKMHNFTNMHLETDNMGGHISVQIISCKTNSVRTSKL
tara:strand:+ start:446 stop:1225 length:780 start_codon:yes stop_codon:yes gene_type:complete